MTLYNCDCDSSLVDETAAVATLGQLARRVLIRMGYATTADNPPPGKLTEIYDYLKQAQDFLYASVASARQSRYFRWPLVEGQRFYGFSQNDDDCPKKIDPGQVEWVGVSDGPVDSEQWRELASGIDPHVYDAGVRTGWPTRFEFRECIEVWPAPDARGGYLRIKGAFGVQPFTLPGHSTSIDPELVFMLALANMRHDYDKPGADKYMKMVQTRIGDLNAQSHQLRRYMPGSPPQGRARELVPRDGWIE